MSQSSVFDYDPLEEQLNAWSHAAGAVLAIIASIFLLIKGHDLSRGQWIGLWAYCLSLILVFSSSALYHFAKTKEKRHWYKKLDHTAITISSQGLIPPFSALPFQPQKHITY